MIANILTHEDWEKFKTELIAELSTLFKNQTQPQKKWLKSEEVKKLLKVSPGTLQTLRINGTLHYTKLGGILYYDYDQIQKTFKDNQRPSNS